MLKSIKQKITTLIPKGNIKGRVLFSYIPEPLLWKDNDRRFDGHSNKWESKEIARIFLDNEYIVDAINSGNEQEVKKVLQSDGLFLVKEMRSHMKEEDWIFYALPKHLTG